LAIVVMVALALLVAIGAGTPTKHPSGFDSDGTLYAAMADPAGFPARYSRTAPWCWRPLTPWMAAQVPGDTLSGFLTLGVLCNFASLLLLYSILRRSRLSFRASLLGVILYAGIFWTLKFSFYSPGYVDFMTQTFLLAILFCTIAGWFWCVPVLLGLGVMQKESLLLIGAVPVYEYVRQTRDPGRIALFAAASLGIGLVVLVGSRLVIEPVNDFDSISSLIRHSAKLTRPDIVPRLLLALFSGLGMLPFLALSDPRGSLQALRANPLWAVLIAVGVVLLFGGADKARLFLYMAPAIVFLAARAMEPLLETLDAPVWLWIGAGGVVHYFIGNQFTAMGNRSEYLSRMVPIHARGDDYLQSLALFTFLSVLWAALGFAVLRNRDVEDAD